MNQFNNAEYESLIAAADVQSSDEQSFDGHMILFD